MTESLREALAELAIATGVQTDSFEHLAAILQPLGVVQAATMALDRAHARLREYERRFGRLPTATAELMTEVTND